jgi:hypothetical protein
MGAPIIIAVAITFDRSKEITVKKTINILAQAGTTTLS